MDNAEWAAPWKRAAGDAASPVDALDHPLGDGRVASMRRHGDEVHFGFVPNAAVVVLSGDDCVEVGMALIAVGQLIRRRGR